MSGAFQTVRTAADGLRYEDALFLDAGPRVGVWTASERSLVCPRAFGAKVGYGEGAAASASSGWPVFQRPTGGGVVPQGPMVVNLALAFDAPSGFKIEDGYRLLVNVIRSGLGSYGDRLGVSDTPDSFCDGAWNLTVGGRKLIGTAQRWRPSNHSPARVLAHAMILIRDEITPATQAVSTLHNALGLAPVRADAHTSLEQAFGLRSLPVVAIQDAGLDALADLETFNDINSGRKKCQTKRSTSILKSQYPTQTEQAFMS